MVKPPLEAFVQNLILRGPKVRSEKCFSYCLGSAHIYGAKIITKIDTTSEKSFKYIDSFFRGESLQRGPGGELEKKVFEGHP